MKKITLLCSALFAVLLMLPTAQAQSKAQKAKDAAATEAPVVKEAPKATKAKVVTKAPSAAEIADAKSKGLVWVNTDSGIFHRDGDFFGKTKQGEFMTEAAALKAGHRAAKTGAVKGKAKAKVDSTKK